MNVQRALLTLAISASLLGSATSSTAATTAPKENADQFIERVNREMREDYREMTAAEWLSSTYINEDSQLVSSKANERGLAKLGKYAEQARAYEGQPMSPATARSLQLLRLGITVPPPKNPASLAELTRIGAKLNGDYGAGKYCPDKGNASTCLDIGKIEDILADTKGKSYEEQLDAWQGWHTISVPMRQGYQRFVELNNEGARDQGFGNTGEL